VVSYRIIPSRMSEAPQFSIVTASYNQGQFIRDCIESVKTQTGVTWEHIVQDAGSTDETLAILKEYPHLQVTCEKDQGMSDGINRGFRKAKGDWVMWLNTDDYLLPGALAKVAEFAAKHPNADVIYGGWHFVDVDKRIKKTIHVFPFDLGMMIHYGCYIGSTSCFLKRRSTIAAGHLLDVQFRAVMDHEYYARLGKAGKRFIHMREVLAGFRMHGNNTSMRYSRDTAMTGILRRQIQLAEGAAVRRFHGWSAFNSPVANGVMDALLWVFYRAKKIMRKLISGSYSSR
jgi:glycosyltransferase involved in cell wall biosynthesis